ncbi:MAG: hypothetical protein IJQ29_05485 [Synergistaceae bacterium]|nr:hypothetical protein [Synergistaceae bacterium]MBQ6909549.1 hypothetical protein [Synergistaceae bacterium]
MEFIRAKAIVIPEGNVKKIEDADGKIIWNRIKITEYTFTIQAENDLEATSKEFILEVEENI